MLHSQTFQSSFPYKTAFHKTRSNIFFAAISNPYFIDSWFDSAFIPNQSLQTSVLSWNEKSTCSRIFKSNSISRNVIWCNIPGSGRLSMHVCSLRYDRSAHASYAASLRLMARCHLHILICELNYMQMYSNFKWLYFSSIGRPRGSMSLQYRVGFKIMNPENKSCGYKDTTNFTTLSKISVEFVISIIR